MPNPPTLLLADEEKAKRRKKTHRRKSVKQEVQLPTGELVEVTVEAEVTGEEIPPLDLQAEMATLLQAEIDSQSGNHLSPVVGGGRWCW